MELIKQIKDAEKQAKDTIEKAAQDAALIMDEAKKQSADLLAQSRQRRIKVIDDAVSAAEQNGQSQADEITQAGSEEISALKASSSGKIQTCVEKVLSRLQQAS